MVRDFSYKSLGPFYFLIISLVASEIFLGSWILHVMDNSDRTERIVVGSFFVTVFIAVLVVFCITYWIKRKYDDAESK